MHTSTDTRSSARWRIFGFAALQWRPQELAIPQVDPAFEQMDVIERTPEVLRYSLLRFEYWISPRGNLREWLRWNTAVAVFLSIPALLIVPLVTFLLGQFATWSALLIQIARNLVLFPLTGIASIVLLSAVALVLRLILPR